MNDAIPGKLQKKTNQPLHPGCMETDAMKYARKVQNERVQNGEVQNESPPLQSPEWEWELRNIDFTTTKNSVKQITFIMINKRLVIEMRIFTER